MTNSNDPINGKAGLTKREYFAALALQSLVSRNDGKSKTTTCEDAVYFADKLIKELNTAVKASAFMEHLNNKKQNPGMRGGFAEEP